MDGNAVHANPELIRGRQAPRVSAGFPLRGNPTSRSEELGNLRGSDELLLARGEGFELHLRPLVADEDGDSRAQLLRGLELLADLGGREFEFHAPTGFPELLHEGERFGTALLLGNDDEDINGTMRGDPLVAQRGCS